MLYAPTYGLFASPTPIPRTPLGKGSSSPTYTYSYQWQELLSSGWTNMPYQTGTGSSQISVLSFSVAERVFRVTVTRTKTVEVVQLSPDNIPPNPDIYCRNLYAPLEYLMAAVPDSASYMPDSCHHSQPSKTPTTTTATSSPIAVEWRPALVEITSTSPAYLESGDENKRTVTLTASASAPPGTTYQWQRRSGTAWTNLGTAGASLTKSATFTTRGTREFRVVAAYNAMGRPFSATSQPLHVTWDEWAIVSDMLTALQTQVTSDASYTNAQTALVNCMNGGSSDSSASDSVSSATTTPSSIGDSTLAPTPTPTPTPTPFTSFDDILSKYTGATKAKMDSGGACHTQAETMFTTTQTLSRSKLAALKSGNAEYTGLLETARWNTFEADVGSSDMLKRLSHFTANQSARTSGSSSETGLGCLPSDSSEPATLQAKLNVLNCLVFDTPHSFWAGSEANELKRRIDTAYDWLGYGDWVCTLSPQGPVPSCKKHDVAFESLQKFAGTAGSDGWGDELDAAWNPRNKALADAKYYADIATHGCQNNTGTLAAILCSRSNIRIAGVYFHGVAKINHKGWPVTTQDYDHAGITLQQKDLTSAPYSFVSCDDLVPGLSNVRLTQRSGQRFAATWEHKSGCVEEIVIEEIDMCWTISFASLVPDEDACQKNLGGDSTSVEFRLGLIYRLIGGDASSSKLTANLTPRNRIYGGDAYAVSY